MADLRHVVGHDLVAALGHHRDLRARPGRRHAEPEKADAERRRDLAHLRQMRHQLGLGLVHGLDRRARQFELPARLQRNRAAAGDVVEPDDVAALHDRLPAEQELHAFEQRADAARAFVRHGLMALERERGLLVLGADAEFGRRLHAGLQPRDEFVARLQRRHIDLVTRHKNSGSMAIRPNARVWQGISADRSVRGRER